VATDWTHIRIPAGLKIELERWAHRWKEQLDAQQQGNHEHPKAELPPLWKVIERLHELEADHREGSRKSKRKRAEPLPPTPIGEDWDIIGPVEPVCEE